MAQRYPLADFGVGGPSGLKNSEEPCWPAAQQLQRAQGKQPQ